MKSKYLYLIAFLFGVCLSTHADNSILTYAPDLGRFIQPDPKAGNYQWLSPYVYCASDPINKIDPNGEQTYYIGMDGRIIQTMRNGGEQRPDEDLYDQIVLIADDGNNIPITPQLTTGTVIRVIQNTAKGNHNQYTDYTSFEIRGDNVATNAFENLSNYITSNRGIEYAIIKTGIEGDKGHNFVTTSHDPGSDASAGWLFNTQLQNGYTIREWNHSHPVGNSASKSDLDMLENLYSDSYNRLFYSKIKFSIYHVPTKKYIQFH